MHCIARPATAPSDTPSFPGRRLGTCIQGRTPKASQGKRAAEVAQAVPGLAAMDWVGWGRRTQCRDGRTRIPGNKTQRGPRDSRPARGPEPQSEYWGAGTSAVGPDLPPRSVPGRCAAPRPPLPGLTPAPARRAPRPRSRLQRPGSAACAGLQWRHSPAAAAALCCFPLPVPAPPRSPSPALLARRGGQPRAGSAAGPRGRPGPPAAAGGAGLLRSHSHTHRAWLGTDTPFHVHTRAHSPANHILNT